MLHKYIIICAGLCSSMLALSQHEDNVTVYESEVAGSVSSGDNTPFWMVSNRYGIVPLASDNAYLKAGVFHNRQLGNHFRWSAGIDMVASVPRYKNVYVHQLYAGLGYRCLSLTVGSKERHGTIADSSLSSGDMILSGNSRPIPGLDISIPEYTAIPLTGRWLQLKGSFAVGRSFDTEYLEDMHADEYYWVKNVLWHYKSFYFKLEDPSGDFPFSATIGAQHVAQWGGASTNPDVGEQPHSLKDLFRIVTGSSGGGNATESDRVNVLGNHHISYDFSLAYLHSDFGAKWYYQHISSDKSGLEFRNGTDGLWGAELTFPRFKFLEKFVFEYVTTRNQSGPFHYISFDHEKHPGRGGGGDNYYNNGEYLTGNSYFGRGLGSPLVISPEYNADDSPGFKCNRIRDFHFGLKGHFSCSVDYRLLLTVMNGWGTASRPFVEKKNGLSAVMDVRYNPQGLPGWKFGCSAGLDTGDMTGGRSIGFGLSIGKQGVLKRW